MLMQPKGEKNPDYYRGITISMKDDLIRNDWRPEDNGMTYLKFWKDKAINLEFYIQNKISMKMKMK